MGKKWVPARGSRTSVLYVTGPQAKGAESTFLFSSVDVDDACPEAPAMSHLHNTADYGTSSNHSTVTPHPPSHTQPVVLTPTLLSALKVSKIFKDNTQIITSLDFDDTGSKCVTSAQDESLHVYDCVTGKYVCSLSVNMDRGSKWIDLCGFLP